MKKSVFQFEVSRICCVTLVAATASIFSGCAKNAANSEALATVGNRQITISDFKEEIEWRKQNERPLPAKEILLGEMIARELALQKARALGLEKDRDVQRTYEDILTSKLKERELASRVNAVKVSADEVQGDYKKNLQRYSQPAKARLALIYLKTDLKMSREKISEQEGRAAEMLSLAKALPENSKGFGQVAMDFSDDQASRYKGGDVGWYDQGAADYRWPTEVMTAGFALNVGDVSEVIKTAKGFFIVRKLETRDAVIAPLEQVQGSIQNRLLTQKRLEAEAAFARELQNFAPVQTNELRLAEIDYPKTTIAIAPESKPPALPRSQ